MNKFPVIIGPTAGGKSTLAVDVALTLCEHYNRPAEILTADSIQIFRHLDIGTAKPTVEERRGIPHHLIDLVEPTDRFSVDAWLEHAERALADCRARDVIPIVVGGTHLYIKAFLEGLFKGPEPDEALREELRNTDPAVRRRELELVDPAAAARIHPNDERRTIRALEIHRLTGTPITEFQQQWDTGRTRDDCVLVGLDWEVEVLNPRINARVKQMIESGLVDEARALWEDNRGRGRGEDGGQEGGEEGKHVGRFGPQAREALGYKQLIEHFCGEASLPDAIEHIKIETRRFAKNQRTWLRRLRVTAGSIWLPMPATTGIDAAQVVVRSILES